MSKKIYRSQTNRRISGVCGGLGEYFNIDPNIIRLFWLLVSISTGGGGILAYIVCTIIIPEDDDSVIYYEDDDQSTFKNSTIFIGLALVVIGSILLTKMIWPQFYFKFHNLRRFWPSLLIIAGIYILYKQYNRK